MRGWRLLAGGVCGLGLLMAAGCASNSQDAYFRATRSRANVYVAPVRTAIDKVALMPFKGPTELIGSSVSDMFVTELLRAGRYQLVERSQMANVLSESELTLAGLSETKAVEVGNMLGADAVIIGTVDEYATVAMGGHPYPVVGIAVRMIDCTSGKVMWSSDYAGRADGKSITLPQQARRVVHEITAGLYQNWQVQRKVPRSQAPRERSGADLTRPVGRSGAAPAPVAPARPPDPPAGFSLSDFGLREVEAKWTAPRDAETRVRAERSDNRDGPFKSVGETSASRLTFKDRGESGHPLQDGTTYYYRLVAVSAAGLESAPTEVRESLTAPPPDPPTELAAEAGAPRAVRLAWRASTAPGVTSYRVERAPAGDPEGFRQVGQTDRVFFEEGGTRSSPLEDATAYRYRVSAVNAVGAVGAPGTPVTVTTLPPPSPPPGLRAETPAGRAVSLAWEPSPSPSVVRYVVERAEEASAPEAFEEVDTVSGCAFAEGGTSRSPLRDSTRYRYRVTSVNCLGSKGPPSEPVSVETRPPPAPVRELRAGDRQVRCVPLSWAASPEPDVIRYDLYRRDPGADTFGRIASLDGRECTEYLDGRRDPGNLADDARYTYRVTAVNAVGAESPGGEEATATTRAPPPAVTGLAAESARPRAVPLRWKPSPDEKVTGYEVQRSGAADGPFEKIASLDGCETATYEDKVLARHWGGADPLADGTTYWYRVAAINTAGVYSEWPAPVSARTKPVPATPTGVAATTNLAGKVRVNWKANPEPDIAFYRVEASRSRDGGFRSVTDVAVDADGGLAAEHRESAPAAAYFYRVRAVDRDALESDWSAPVAGATKPLPDAPEELAAEWSDAGARLTWKPPPQPDVASYRVWEKGFFRSSPIATNTVPEWTLDRAAVGKGLSVQVTAIDADGLESEPGAVFQIRPPAP